MKTLNTIPLEDQTIERPKKNGALFAKSIKLHSLNNTFLPKDNTVLLKINRSR